MTLYMCSLCEDSFSDNPKSIVLILEKEDEKEWDKIVADEVANQNVSKMYALDYRRIWNRFYVYLANRRSEWLCDDCYNELVKKPIEDSRERNRVAREVFYRNVGEK